MTYRQQGVAGFIYFLFGVIVFIIFIGSTLKFFGVEELFPFFRILFDIRDFFLLPFKGIYPDIPIGPVTIDLAGFTGSTFYTLFGYLIATFVVSFVEINPLRIIRNLISTFFTLIEFFLFSRVVLKLLAASSESSFVNFVYKLLNFGSNPFGNILAVNLGNHTLEILTFIVLAVIVTIHMFFLSTTTAFFRDERSNRR